MPLLSLVSMNIEDKIFEKTAKGTKIKKIPLEIILIYCGVFSLQKICACEESQLVSYQAEIDSLQYDFNRRNMFDLLCIICDSSLPHSLFNMAFFNRRLFRLEQNIVFICFYSERLPHYDSHSLKNSDQSSVRIELTRISGEIRDLNSVWHYLRSYVKARKDLSHTFCSRQREITLRDSLQKFITLHKAGTVYL